MKKKSQFGLVLTLVVMIFYLKKFSNKSDVTTASYKLLPVSGEHVLSKIITPPKNNTKGSSIQSLQIKKEIKEYDAKIQLVAEISLDEKGSLGVCSNLGSAPISMVGDKLKKLNGLDFYSKEAELDSVLRAIRIPNRAIHQNPEHVEYMKVFEMITRGLSPIERRRRLNEWGSKKRLMNINKRMMENKKHFEMIADRANNLTVLAKIAILRPEFIYHKKLINLCDSIEKFIISKSSDNIQEERKAVLSILKEAHLTPEEVEFKPDHYNQLTLKYYATQVDYVFTPTPISSLNKSK